MHELAPNAANAADWNVERITDDGLVEMAIFAGPNARERAEVYAGLMNQQDGSTASV